jgi:hypothetical protein
MLDASNPDAPDAYIPPSPYSTDLSWAMQRAQLRLAQAEMQGCPEGNLQLLRDFILDCDTELNGKQPPPGAAPPMAPSGMPPGPPPMPVAEQPPMPGPPLPQGPMPVHQ